MAANTRDAAALDQSVEWARARFKAKMTRLGYAVTEVADEA